MMAEEIIENKEWYMAAYADKGVPTSTHLKLRRVPLPVGSLAAGHVVVEVLWISIDPYLRTRMTGLDDGLYFPQFKLNETIVAFGIGRVRKSKDERYKEGDVVLHPYLPVAEYCVIPGDQIIRKLDPEGGVSLPEFLSCLGVPGFAAWVGIEVLGEVKAGSNIFISAAAGGVGMYAGQLAKLKGCRVVGSTGSDDKVRLLKEELGYDDAFNYNKETDFDAALAKYFPDGIDIYLDNVGGKMFEAVLNHVNKYARIPVCGMISQYNQVWTEREGVRNLLNIVGKEVKIQGYLVGSYLDKFADFGQDMENYMKQGKIKSKLKIIEGIESFQESISSMFSSSNFGKVVLRVKD